MCLKRAAVNPWSGINFFKMLTACDFPLIIKWMHVSIWRNWPDSKTPYPLNLCFITLNSGIWLIWGIHVCSVFSALSGTEFNPYECLPGKTVQRSGHLSPYLNDSSCLASLYDGCGCCLSHLLLFTFLFHSLLSHFSTSEMATDPMSLSTCNNDGDVC